jgi:hypothetical protein
MITFAMSETAYWNDDRVQVSVRLTDSLHRTREARAVVHMLDLDRSWARVRAKMLGYHIKLFKCTVKVKQKRYASHGSCSAQWRKREV